MEEKNFCEEIDVKGMKHLGDSNFRSNINKFRSSHTINIPFGINDNKLIYDSIDYTGNILVGGNIGIGKTNYIYYILYYLLTTLSPDDLGLIIYDDKEVDYNILKSLSHLLAPVISDIDIFSAALENINHCIDNRLDFLLKNNCRSITDYNSKYESKLKHILIIIDSPINTECSADFNYYLERVSEMGPKVGVNIILTSSYLSGRIITQITRLNLPTRLCFNVSSKQISNKMIDMPDAINLSRGEGLLKSVKYSPIINVKIPEIEDEDIITLVQKWSNYPSTNKNNDVIMPKIVIKPEVKIKAIDDPLYNEIVDFAIETRKVSASLLQRRFRITYYHAARLVDQLEENGIIGPQNGSKPREVLIKGNESTSMDAESDESIIIDNSNSRIVEQNKTINTIANTPTLKEKNLIYKKSNIVRPNTTVDNKLLLEILKVLFIVLIIWLVLDQIGKYKAQYKMNENNTLYPYSIEGDKEINKYKFEIGERIYCYQKQFEVKSVTKQSSLKKKKASKENTFLIVELNIKNASSKSKTYYRSDFYIKLNNGTRIEASSDFNEKDSYTLNANENANIKINFEIPKNTEKLSVIHVCNSYPENVIAKVDVNLK